MSKTQAATLAQGKGQTEEKTTPHTRLTIELPKGLVELERFFAQRQGA